MCLLITYQHIEGIFFKPLTVKYWYTVKLLYEVSVHWLAGYKIVMCEWEKWICLLLRHGLRGFQDHLHSIDVLKVKDQGSVNKFTSEALQNGASAQVLKE